jgi:[acyl-carrier-protein] S-malonyltransferase
MISTKGKIAFCFPGQLQERPKLEAHHPLWKDPLFLGCAEKASLLTKIDLLDFFSPGDGGGGDFCLNLQVATYLLSMVHFYRLQAAGWVPDILAEHSMGVYAALAASEAVTFEEGLVITESIGRLLQKAEDSFRGAMASIIGLPLKEVQKICYDLDGHEVFIANHNGSMHYVLSGEEKGIDEAISLALSRKAISASRLAFNTALHSSSLLALREEILHLMRDIKVRPPRFPILNHWTVKPLEEEEVKDFLSQEIGRPVYWARCVEKMAQEGVTQFIEVGHEATLTKLIRWINRDVEAFCAGDRL